MNVTKKPEFTDKEIGINPMANDLYLPVVVYPSTLMRLSEGIKVPDEVEMEQTPYTKVFKIPDYRKYVANLSNNAKSLYIWILYEVETGKDALWINRERYMKENNIKSITTVTEALNELHRYVFICPTIVKNVYWINPALFFSGSRIKKYPNNLVVKKSYIED